MAGDWIKIEKATPRKTEVVRIARLLEVSPLHALGACVAFWSWADDATEDGYLPGIDASMLDGVLGIPGLTAAMVDVQWLIELGDGLQIANHDRHNGNNAKKRALSNRRKVDYREREAERSKRSICVP